MIRRLTAITLLLQLSVSLSPILAETTLFTIQLRNRPATEVQPLLAQLLQGEAIVVANGDSLLIKAHRDASAEIKNMIRSLDTPLHNLLISVIQSDQLSADELNAAARIGGHLNHPDENRVRMRGFYGNTALNKASKQTKSIRTLEGQAAYIKTGTLHPVSQVGIYATPYTLPSVSINTRLLEASSGFIVVPHLHGQQVTLQVSPWSENLRQNGIVETRSAQTTLKVKPGEWVELGGSGENQRQQQQGLFKHQRSTLIQGGRILVKVEIIP